MPPILWLSGVLSAQAQAVTPSTPGDLIITEFMAEPVVVPNYFGEWFEITNASGRNLDLNGLTVSGSSGDAGFQISGSTTLAAGAYFVFGVESDTIVNGGVSVDYEYSRSLLDLDHTGDTLTLSYGGTTIDQVVWDTASGWTVDQKRSHQANVNAITSEWANDLAHNWCQAANADIAAAGWYGTPGAANSLCADSTTDDDGDGYSEVDGDCDDDDASVNPDAIDGDSAPYGVADDDADCDGVRDDGVTDDDGDGYSETDGDCDDSSSQVNPGESERNDGADNDCNGCVDDLDTDGDGWTTCDTDAQISCDGSADCDDDPSDPSCVPALDCDDDRNSVYPCATEAAYNGVDEDCDGSDLCDVDNDGYDSDECAGVEPDMADCDDTDPAVNPAAEEVENGVDDDCDGQIDSQTDTGDPVAEGDCAADLVMAFPDASTTAFDGCHATELTVAFEFDPDDAPEQRSLHLAMNADTSPDADCRLSLTVQGMCGPGLYPVGDATQAELITYDCPGVADDYETTASATRGTVEIVEWTTGAGAGSTSSDPIPVQMQAELHITFGDISLDGPVQLSATVLGTDAEEMDCLGTTPGDDTGGGDNDDDDDDDDDGGGGCGCASAAHTGAGPGGAAWLGLGALIGLLWRRRRQP